MSKGKPSSSPMAVHQAPDPVAVARLIESHSMAAAVGRYYWLSAAAVQKLGQRGREILRGQSDQPGPVARTRRTTNIEQEDAAVAAALRLSSVHRASRETGLKHSFILTLLNERGIPVPRLSREERVKAVSAGLARRAAQG